MDSRADVDEQVSADPSATVVNSNRVKSYKQKGAQRKEQIEWNTRLEIIDKARKDFFPDQTLAKVDAWDRAINDARKEVGTDQTRQTYLDNHSQYVEKIRLLVNARTGTGEIARVSKINMAETLKYLMDNQDGIHEQTFFPDQRKKSQLALNEGIHPSQMQFYADLVKECNDIARANKPSSFARCFAILYCCKPRRKADALLPDAEVSSRPSTPLLPFR
jgi:hypothetical protein